MIHTLASQFLIQYSRRFTNKQLWGTRRDIPTWIIIVSILLIMLWGSLTWEKYDFLYGIYYNYLIIPLAFFWIIIWLITFKYVRPDPSLKLPLWVILGYSAGAIFALTGCCITIFKWYNATFDKSDSNIYVVRVLNKEMLGGRVKYFKLTTEPLQKGELSYTNVFEKREAEHLYVGAFPGSRIKIVTGNGALGVEWVKSFDLSQ